MGRYKKRKDGRFSTTISMGKDENGKPVRKYICAASEKELQEKVKRIKRTKDTGIDIDESSSFRSTAELFLSVKEPLMSASEFKTLKARLEYFTDIIGRFPLDDITVVDIQKIINDISAVNPVTGKPSAKNTVNRYISAVYNVFEFAIQNRIIEYNPAKYVKVPKGLKTDERRSLTDEERAWVENTPHRGQLPAMIGIYAGLRKGELTALKWSDIDLINATITVNKSYDFKGYRVKTPKTKAGVRVVNIPQKLVDFLKAQEKTCPYVVHTLDGRMMTYSAWQSVWRSFILELDRKYGEGEKPARFHPHIKQEITINPFTIHECRHTFCSLMYLSGVDILTAQKQMGHTDIKTTLGIYAHLDEKYKRKNISKLDDFLNGSLQNYLQNPSQMA